MIAEMQVQDGKVKWKNSKCHPSYKELLGIDGEAIEFEWNIVPGFLSLQILQEIQNDLRKTEHRTWQIHRPNHLHVKCSTTSIGQGKATMDDGICISIPEKVKEHAKGFSQGHLPYTFEGKMDSTATQMEERFKDTGHPVFERISALRRRILKKKHNKDTIHVNADATKQSSYSESIHSVKQLSFYGAVSNWCKQFGLTEEEQKLERPLAR